MVLFRIFLVFASFSHRCMCGYKNSIKLHVEFSLAMGHINLTGFILTGRLLKQSSGFACEDDKIL